MTDILDVLDIRPPRPSHPVGSHAARFNPDGSTLYRSTKTYGHNEGLSCCFRQWRARHSHCRLVHGYALSFHFVFATRELDERNWCFDFGGLKPVRTWLHHMFDHTILVAEDDPSLQAFQDLADADLVDLRVVPAVGCEATAKHVHDFVARFIDKQSGGRVWLESVEVREHAGNSAIYSDVRSSDARP